MALRRNPSRGSQTQSIPEDGDDEGLEELWEQLSAAMLRSDPFLLGRLLRARAAQLRRTAVLFVDQLEELLATSDTETRLAYLRSIALAADDPVDPVRVILTLRDDFLGRLALDADIRRALSRVFVVQPPGPAGLQRILEAPVEARGYSWEDTHMVTELVASTDGLVASLPLLQVAGTLLWERRDSHRRVIPRTALDAFGGLHGALAHHADTVLAGCSPAEQDVQQRLLLRLVTPDETRAVVPLSTLREAVGTGLDEALERLVTHRLVNLQRAEGGNTDVELVHEALITHWHRLRRWLDEGRADHRLSSEVEDAAGRWDSQEESPHACLTGPRLEHALSARSTRNLKLSPLANRFLEASLQRSRHRKRLRRLLALGMASLTVLLLIALVGALWQRSERLRVQDAMLIEVQEQSTAAQQQRDAATAALLAMRSSEDSRRQRNTAALVRAIAGFELARVSGDPALAERLWAQVLSTRARSLPMHHIPPESAGENVSYTTWAPGGARVATADATTASMKIFDLQTGQTIETRSICEASLRGGAWSRDGTRLAHQCTDTFGVQILDTEGALLQELPCGPVGTRPGDKRGMVAWMDGQLYVGTVGGICVYAGDPLRQIRHLELEGQVARLGVSERWVAASIGNADGQEISTRVWDRASGAVHLELTGDPSFLRHQLLNDRFLVRRFTGAPEQMDVWSLDETPPRRAFHLEAQRRWSGTAAFDLDQSHLISTWGQQLRRWSTEDWSEEPAFALDSGDRATPLISPDGSYLVEASWNGQLRVLDATSGAVLFNDATLRTRLRPVGFVDADRLLTYTSTEGLLLWDLSALPRNVISRPGDVVSATLVGSRYWWLSADGSLRTGTANGETTRVVGSAQVSDTPSLLAVSETSAIVSTEGRWTAWHVESPVPIWSRPAVPEANGADLSPDGRFLAIRTLGGMLILWNEDGREVTRQRIVAGEELVLDGQNYGVISPGFTRVYWTPDSSSLVAEQMNSGERWRCLRDRDWSCLQWPHQIRQSLLHYGPEGQFVLDRRIEHSTEQYIIRRLDPQTGAPLWEWKEDTPETIINLDAGTNRGVVVSPSGRMMVLTSDGELEHSLSLDSVDKANVTPMLIDDDRRVAAISSSTTSSMWLWDLEEQRLASHKQGVVDGGWLYRLTKHTAGAQLWAQVGERALIPMEAPPTEQVDAVLTGALTQTNQRVCRDTLDVVSVVPYPDSSSPWASPADCGDSRGPDDQPPPAG